MPFSYCSVAFFLSDISVCSNVTISARYAISTVEHGKIFMPHELALSSLIGI